jgi:dimethylsulfone monooxygenase
MLTGAPVLLQGHPSSNGCSPRRRGACGVHGQPRMALQFGIWSPVCGGWLRLRTRCRSDPRALLEHAALADRLGYDFYYIPEHYLNAVYGPSHDVAEAWITAAAAVARTERIRVMTAVQPGFKTPAVTAKMAAGLASLRPDSFGLSLVAGWWRLEAEMYGDSWLAHDERYRRAAEYLDVIRGLWTADVFSYQGQYFRVERGVLRPRPEPQPIVFVAGESDAAVDLAARAGDYLFVNGDDIERVQALGERLKTRARQRHGRRVRLALSAFGLVRDETAAAEACVLRLQADADLETIRYFDEQMDRQVVAHNRGTDQDHIEANLGLRAGLVGDGETIRARLRRFEAAGVDAILLKLEGQPDEAERFARQVIAPHRQGDQLSRRVPPGQR